MKKIICIPGALLFIVILLACSPKGLPVEKPALPETIAPGFPPPSKEAWQVEWEKTRSQARKEGKLNIYVEMPSAVREAWQKNLKDKFGILAEFVIGRGAETSNKILSEKRAGLSNVDIYITGGTTMYTVMKPAGLLEPFEKELILPEVVDPKGWFDGRLPWLDQEHTIFTFSLAPSNPTYSNTDVLKPGEVKSYWDLLKPQFKGKILMNDPTVSGQGLQWFSMYGGEGILGIDYMKAFVKQEPLLMRDMRQQAEWTARGKYLISVAIGWSTYEPFITAGAPIYFISLKEPDYLSGAFGHLTWIKDAPHPAAAKLFANWLLSQEGQLTTQKAWERQSARVDIGDEGIKPVGLRRADIKYLNAETEAIYNKKMEYQRLAKEIFGPLAK